MGLLALPSASVALRACDRPRGVSSLPRLARPAALQEALGTTISWGTWALSGLVPGIICLLLTPAIL